MITGELKNRIDGLGDIFAAGGLVNSLDVIEQIPRPGRGGQHPGQGERHAGPAL